MQLGHLISKDNGKSPIRKVLRRLLCLWRAWVLVFLDCSLYTPSDFLWFRVRTFLSATATRSLTNKFVSPLLSPLFPRASRIQMHSMAAWSIRSQRLRRASRVTFVFSAPGRGGKRRETYMGLWTLRSPTSKKQESKAQLKCCSWPGITVVQQKCTSWAARMVL